MSNKIYEKLLNVQQKLNVPKTQKNDHGKYMYRSCEDIMNASKPILKEEKAVIILSDEIVQMGDRYYVKASALLKCTETLEEIQVHAFARESLSKKGMDDSQITGSTSSYARKYALNGLLAIDDTKDSDTNERLQEESRASKEAYKEELTKTKEHINALVVDLSKTFKVDVSSEQVKKYVEDKTGIKNSMSIGTLSLNDAKKLASAYEGIVANKQKAKAPEKINIDDI